MANVKTVEITGTLPFDCDKHDDMCKILATLNTPVMGLRLTWGVSAGAVPNEHGGQTAMYKFGIIGEEAVSWSYLDHMVKSIHACGGTIDSARANDPEDGMKWKYLR